jgi:hypothetical protein
MDAERAARHGWLLARSRISASIRESAEKGAIRRLSRMESAGMVRRLAAIREPGRFEGSAGECIRGTNVRDHGSPRRGSDMIESSDDLLARQAA